MENTKTKETFGQRLSRLRKNSGYTQEEIAEKECVSPQAVSKWENDITSPDIRTLIDLSNLYNVSLDELMGKEKTEEKTNFVPEDQGRDISKMLLKIKVVDGGDKININLPVALVKMFLENGKDVPVKLGNKNKDLNIDFDMIINLIEQGVMGELLTAEDEDGAHITISVE